MEYTIMLLDNNQETLETTKTYLENLSNIKILPFIDPIQALRRIHLFELPNLIITEVDLPKMNGIKFLGEVLCIHPSVNAVIYTSAPESIPPNIFYPVILKGPEGRRDLIQIIKSIIKFQI